MLFLLNNRHTQFICYISLISLGLLDLFVPKTTGKLNIGKRAFSVAAPTIWNQLPIKIKSSETIDTFR